MIFLQNKFRSEKEEQGTDHVGGKCWKTEETTQEQKP